jgi:hypothetical protein
MSILRSFYDHEEETGDEEGAAFLLHGINSALLGI